jgi:hypothetical protein
VYAYDHVLAHKALHVHVLVGADVHVHMHRPSPLGAKQGSTSAQSVLTRKQLNSLFSICPPPPKICGLSYTDLYISNSAFFNNNEVTWQMLCQG